MRLTLTRAFESFQRPLTLTESTEPKEQQQQQQHSSAKTRGNRREEEESDFGTNRRRKLPLKMESFNYLLSFWKDFFLISFLNKRNLVKQKDTKLSQEVYRRKRGKRGKGAMKCEMARGRIVLLCPTMRWWIDVCPTIRWFIFACLGRWGGCRLTYACVFPSPQVWFTLLCMDKEQSWI